MDIAKVVEGKKISSDIKRAIVVPGSGLVAEQAVEEGLDKIFVESGFEWRAPGCSMCLAMNPDQLGDGEHCASTSNRNFEGRQGYGGRTHLVSPATAAASAIEGRFVDVWSASYDSFLGLDMGSACWSIHCKYAHDRFNYRDAIGRNGSG